jgi:hypothetical protein
VFEGVAHLAVGIAVLQPRARMQASAVPETTPSWSVWETARAKRQSETPAPIPPWMICGCDMMICPKITAR